MGNQAVGRDTCRLRTEVETKNLSFFNKKRTKNSAIPKIVCIFALQLLSDRFEKMRKIKVLSFFILACFFASLIVRTYTSVGEVNSVMNNVNTIKMGNTDSPETDTLEAQLFIDLKIKDLKEENVRWNAYNTLTGDSILLLPTSAHCFLSREHRPLTVLEKTYKALSLPATVSSRRCLSPSLSSSSWCCSRSSVRKSSTIKTCATCTPSASVCW